MKILSDFDGVLTDLTHEALRVKELFRAALCAVATTTDVESLLAQGEDAMCRGPHRHGWRHKGRITAFCNEDGFIRVNAMGACLDGMVRDGEGLARDVLLQLQATSPTRDYCEIAQKSYVQMTAETSAGASQPIDRETRPVMEELLRRGHEIVVVSNSGTDRIIELFSRAGVPAFAHGTSGRTGALRVRGNAKKFELGDSPRCFDVGEYRVDTDRPFYEKILLEERPDLVIGDVFSLDLALPSQLGVRTVLRRRIYTPEWSMNRFIRVPSEGNQMEVGGVIINRLDQLVELT